MNYLKLRRKTLELEIHFHFLPHTNFVIQPDLINDHVFVCFFLAFSSTCVRGCVPPSTSPTPSTKPGLHGNKTTKSIPGGDSASALLPTDAKTSAALCQASSAERGMHNKRGHLSEQAVQRSSGGSIV